MVRERVKKGMEFLDINVPGWRSQISIERLDMGSCEDCILGQLFGHYWAAPWPRDNMSPDKPWDYTEASAYGFAGGLSGYDVLTEAWVRELR